MTRRAVGWPLLVQAGLVLGGYAAVRPMTGYRAIELQAGNTGIGLLAASFSVLPLLLAYPVGRQADRFGPARLMVVGVVLFTGAGVLAMLAGSLPVLLVASALLGLGQLVSVVGQQATVAVSGTANLDRGFGLLTAAGAVGQAVGPLLAAGAASVPGVGPSPAAVGLAVGTAICAASALCLRPLLRAAPRSRAPAPRSSWRVAAGMVGVPGMAATLVAGGVVLAALDLLSVFLPAWADERGVPVAAVGGLLALRAVVTLLARLVVDRVVARAGRRLTMVASIAVAGLGLLVLPLVRLPGAAVIMLLLGIGLGVAQPLAMSWVADAARPGTRGAAMGLRLTANRLAQTALPVAVGAFSAGAAGVFWAVGALLALSAGALLRMPPDRTRPPAPPAKGL
ncbi:MFS transporter [Micromonospora sp. WMMD1128]|uniref:MFS transporter n=1 Tax=Micromonospora sp. WMMD1128 TaxID=3015150 RepID=UPI00248B5DF8|nr:MFS transporter [Micromonospora sp. WMMD1128]WBB75636.1 MFS transporter [Micromonospora sp. WMMD1128]